MKLSLSMIVKNAAGHLERTLASLKPLRLDELVIVDTGSTDGTQELARRLATTFAEYEDPDPIEIDGVQYLSDFARARNFSKSLVTSDFFFWIDADDVLVGAEALRAYIDRLVEPDKIDALFMHYDYQRDARGKVNVRQLRERVIRTGMHTWCSPLHEVLCAHHSQTISSVAYEDAHILHEAKEGDVAVRRKRNVLICERFLKRYGGNQEPRFFLNYGRSLYSCERYDEALKALKRYVKESGWNEEKYFAWQIISSCLDNLGDPERSLEALFKAVRLLPECREAYIDLAARFAKLREFDKALFYAERALDAQGNNSGYQSNPGRLATAAYEIQAIALMELGKFREAASACDAGLKIDQLNEELIMKRAIAARLLRESEAVESFKKIEFLLELEGNSDKVNALHRSLPCSLNSRPEFAMISHRGKPRYPRLGMFCGATATPWGHRSIEKGGVGGSETAVIRMSTELAKLGWGVEVYGFMEPEDEGLHAGVNWLPYWRFPGKDSFDIFISWRTPYVSLAHAEARYIWLHDVQMAEHWRPEELRAVDQVMVLSEAHRRNCSFIPDEKVLLTGNGLDPSFFQRPDNQPHALIYASCPSRGLHLLLPHWRSILKRFPDATLDIYYGFTPHFLESMRTRANLQEVYQTVNSHLSLPGIRWHGMRPQADLSLAFHRAGIFAYPCSFAEISCITAMQAQAAGAIPVTTNYWALEETVQHGVKVDTMGKPIEARGAIMENWLAELLELMGDEKRQKEIRKKMIPWAREKFLWSEVAKQWDQAFRDKLKIRKSLSARPEPEPALVS